MDMINEIYEEKPRDAILPPVIEIPQMSFTEECRQPVEVIEEEEESDEDEV